MKLQRMPLDIQGVVTLSFLFAQIFNCRNSRYLPFRKRNNLHSF
ncbi:hypothetical protein LMANV2_740005 [Leptospira interrogans serovar Manilae]|uniref:Uncharacterized protein n=1 Tax=Leptospira interrogans serovar Manilae TaxID=214675 RepID=A0AAQ1P130_LEPIR|nr:hypothetical protein LMANV2_740005 [Leptospira interrogans serovar Manilae]